MTVSVLSISEDEVGGTREPLLDSYRRIYCYSPPLSSNTLDLQTQKTFLTRLHTIRSLMENKCITKLCYILTITSLISCQNTSKTATRASVNGSAKKNIESFPKVRDGPMRITTRVFIIDVSDINAASMDFRIDLFLQQKWVVETRYCESYRVHLNELGLNVTNGETNIVPPNKINSVWIPDTYVMTAKTTDTQSKELQAKTLMVTIIAQKCHMRYTVRWFSLISCQLDFRKYPRDIQLCYFNLRSFSYPETMLHFQWSKDMEPNYFSREINMLEYDFFMTKGVSNITMLNVTYSVLTLSLRFERELAHQMLHVYTPSILVVLLAWLSFWMGMDAVPARATICVTSLLSLITMFTGNSNRLPPVSYANRMDLWMMVCMVFVFSTLVEFAFVKYLGSKKETKIGVRSTPGGPQLRLPSYNVNRILARSEFPTTKVSFWDTKGWTPLDYELKHPKSAPATASVDRIKRIDVFFRVFYLISFALFNFIYWPLLLARV